MFYMCRLLKGDHIRTSTMTESTRDGLTYAASGVVDTGAWRDQRIPALVSGAGIIPCIPVLRQDQRSIC
jgi:hypothetical protein